jgi:hypothetical protein
LVRLHHCCYFFSSEIPAFVAGFVVVRKENPMASFHTISNVLWLSQPVLAGVVAVSLWRQKLHKEFPFFMAYLLAQMATVAVLFPVYNFASDHFFYHYWYFLNWGANIIAILLGFRVLYEIFLDVFKPFRAINDLGTVLFRWGALVMLLVGVVVAASAKTDLPVIEQVLVAIQRCVRLAQMGLVLFLLSFASHLGIHWRHRSFGLALGFGFFAFTELIVYALFLDGRGYILQSTATIVNMLAYDSTILIWLTYCWMKSPVTVVESARLKTQRWDRSLSEIQHPEPAESLIPMFEDMVERALARSSPAMPQKPAPFIERAVAGK